MRCAIYYRASDTIAAEHAESREEVSGLDALLHAAAPGPLRIGRAADRLRLEEGALSLLLGLYEAEGVVTRRSALVCPECDALVEKSDTDEDEGRAQYYCDLCDTYVAAETIRIETVFYIAPPADATAPAAAVPIKETRFKGSMSYTRADEFGLARITPWAAHPPGDFVVESGTLGDIEAGRVLEKVEHYGIALFRMSGQSPDEALVRAMGRLIGPSTPTQNTFTGEVKNIRPAPEGKINSGDTTKDLGLHVDGTQHEEQPAILIFQYVTEPKFGADSIFVDGARVLADVEETRRHQAMTALAHPDAATFEKSGMRYTGPVFSMAGPHSVRCRIRFDEVMRVLPELKEDYEFLRDAFNRDGYRASFKPREGDIIIFDNWRLLHARDEVFGHRVREHRRIWISHLKPEHQSRFNLGIRPLPLETLAEISRKNRI